ncbi:MAG: alpha-galactosidase [Clostridiales bacterium]|nr:alpha-galactosidase [Clostridiales bacterium]
MKYLDFHESELFMTFGIHQGFIRLLHFSDCPYQPSADLNMADGFRFFQDGYQFAQIQAAGVNRPFEKQGNMFIATMPGCRMKYISHDMVENADGKELVILQKDEETGIAVKTHFRFYTGLSCVRTWNEVINQGEISWTMEYVGTFSYLGIEKEGEGTSDDKMLIHVPYNGWQRELSWQSHTFAELGLAQTQPEDYFRRTSRNVVFSNTGNWSTKDYIPMGILENTETNGTLFFQIEHNGSWEWEIGMQANHFYLNLSGPEEVHGHFSKTLKPGDQFVSVPACVGTARGSISEAVDVLTKYRRIIRRRNADNEKLPVIFNDYMNCLYGNPTWNNEIPMIEAAARAGCEYYVIDAGWYAPGEWWDGVGEWKESCERFPQGLKALTDVIRSHGMIPGLWLELEVMGIHCPLMNKVPKDWFFTRHGSLVYDRSRVQLDFRNPEVRAYADGIIDRLVNTYGAGYIKMDYNIEPGIGTDRDAESPGVGLLEHERAYLKWLDSIFERYPELVIENCSSGGMRMDYAMLSRYSIQSTSDQENYVSYSTIACNAPSAVTSEQAAVWSYPKRDADEENAAFNMINAMLCRIHQSGHLVELAPKALEIVKEGIHIYKNIRKDIYHSLPYWPLGFAHAADAYAALVLRNDKKLYLAVWRRFEDGTEDVDLPLDTVVAGRKVQSVQILYPSAHPMQSRTPYHFDEENCILHVHFKDAPVARLFALHMDASL